MKSDEGLSEIQPAAPSPTDPTRTSPPLVSPQPLPAQPSMVPQLRDHTRYDILSEHGRGGLGRVSRAHDRELGRDIAIKELISRGYVSEIRFLREALITARLEHPGIVPVYEAGRWADGTPFYAMKLVAGRPLRDLILERNTVDERIGLLHHVIAVADAIAYAHGRNIIHRDLKPANVIVGDFGETVVIDWGLAKDLSADEEATVSGGPFRTHLDDGLTSTGSILGTPAYMPPEQERGEPVDQRADVYAIGAMLWELCSLKKLPPAYAGQRGRILRRAGIDSDLVVIIEKACCPDPARRYPDAGSLAADLKAFKAGTRIAARRYSLWAVLAHWTRRHRALALFVLAVLVVGAIVAVVYIHNVSAARDRAGATLTVAKQELERAQLAEAALLVEKDPTSAKDLLASLPQRSPQYALLSSRAKQVAATQVIPLPTLARLLTQPSTSMIIVVTIDGAFDFLDLDTGQLHLLDRDLLGAVTSRGTGWLYARRPFGASNVTLVATDSGQLIDAGTLLPDLTDQIAASGSRLYALNKHDLYALQDGSWSMVEHGVRSIVGNGHLLMLCSTTNELEVLRDGVYERRARCVQSSSLQSLALADDSYAALQDNQSLLLVRNGTPLELPTQIAGGSALALAPSGLLAVADVSDKAWLVRPGGATLELGPVHASLPTSAAAGNRIAAWGYADGTVVALDITTNAVWTFKGHSSRVTSLAVDPGHARVVSLAGNELRVWSLTTSPLREVPHLPCTIYTLLTSPDGKRAAMDCSDGALRVWDLSTGTIRELHHHKGGLRRRMVARLGMLGRIRRPGPLYLSRWPHTSGLFEYCTASLAGLEP